MSQKTSKSFFCLRDWMERAERAGELRRVEGAQAELEIGAISELNSKSRGPALFFTEIPGCRADFGLITGSMLNEKTLGITLGTEENLSNLEMVDRVADLLASCSDRAGDYPMEFVDEGPVMENKLLGDDVDLTMFPAPLWHEKDGGPYIGTGCVQIHRDPETGWVNLGTYRVQLLGKNRLSNYISPGHHGHIIRQKYWSQGKPAPVVISLGHHPIVFLMASSDVPTEADELSWIGAIAKGRVPVVRGPVTGLPIPAYSEVAVEGYCYPDREMSEGPFGEFTGYYAGGRKTEPYVEVKAVYYRSHPIILGSPPSRPINDFSYFFSIMRSASIREALRKAGVPGVRGVWVYEASGGRMMIVTSISQQYAGHAGQTAVIAGDCQAGGLMSRYSIVVDEDIDPSSPDDLIWALSTRTDPQFDIDILRQCWSNPLDPMLTAEQKERKQLYNSRAIINACKPFDRLNDFPAVAEASPELLKAVKTKWAQLWN